MIKNYLVTTLRNFIRNGTYTAINVLGLSIGITACITIYVLISYELSFDKFNSKYDQIYRVIQETTSQSGIDSEASVPYPFIGALRNDVPEVPLATNIHYEEDVLVKIGADKQRIDNVIFADSMFFDVFDYEVLSGNPKVELGQPGRVFLTKSLADKIMTGDKLTMKVNNQVELEVVGIVADPPVSSHINYSMIISYPSLNKDFVGGMDMTQWGLTIAGYTYVVLPDGISTATLESRLNGFVPKYRPDEIGKKKYFLQPLSDIHFNREFNDVPGDALNVDISSLVTMAVLGLFILAIACVNFVNLATALAIKKSKEIGIRKTLGAKRTQLTLYFLGETSLIIIVSVLISLAAAEWLVKWLSGFLDKTLKLSFINDPWLVIFIAGLAVLSTLLAGFYPSVILSGFNPVAVLKNKMSAQGSSSGVVRKVLVVFQFTIAQVLIIGTLIISDQMGFLINKPLGFDQEAIINVELPNSKRELMQSFGTRLDAISGVSMVSFSLGGPTSDNNFGSDSYLTEKGKDSEFSVSVKLADRFYKDVYGLQLKAGRWFTEAEEKAASDVPDKERRYVFVVNEAYSRKAGFDNPNDIIGKKITVGINAINTEVIGVLADFHTQSLHEEIIPTVILSFPYFYYDAGIKVTGGSYKELIQQIRASFDAAYPEFEFEYEFMDDHLAKLYRQDERTFVLFKIFSGVAIFIGCLGLYGLVSFMANQKLKEVGIRKVLGASVNSIVWLFGVEFVKLIAIAFVVATPLTFFFMREWLNGFAYRTTIEWTDFGVGIAATAIIALVTVSYQSIKAAIANPVNVLRAE
jgi:ABC-type antimicrobial peptide transport system permease subunit